MNLEPDNTLIGTTSIDATSDTSAPMSDEVSGKPSDEGTQQPAGLAEPELAVCLADAVGQIRALVSELDVVLGNLHEQLLARVTPGPAPEQADSATSHSQRDPLTALWQELGDERPGRFWPCPPPGELPARLHQLVWQLAPEQAEQVRAALCAAQSWRDSGLPSQLLDLTEITIDQRVADILGDRYPPLAQAVTGILTIAEHGNGLGLIDLKQGAGGPWLTRYRPETHFDGYRDKLLDCLGRFVVAENSKAREYAVFLDMSLRLLVPAVFSGDGDTSGRLVPPAPDSQWVTLLDACLAAVKDRGEQAEPTFTVGLPPRGVLLQDAMQDYHVAANESLSHQGNADEANRVLWPFGAWAGQDKPKLLARQSARVVYGANP